MFLAFATELSLNTENEKNMFHCCAIMTQSQIRCSEFILPLATPRVSRTQTLLAQECSLHVSLLPHSAQLKPKFNGHSFHMCMLRSGEDVDAAACAAPSAGGVTSALATEGDGGVGRARFATSVATALPSSEDSLPRRCLLRPQKSVDKLSSMRYSGPGRHAQIL